MSSPSWPDGLPRPAAAEVNDAIRRLMEQPTTGFLRADLAHWPPAMREPQMSSWSVTARTRTARVWP
jgi:hypothetical protein